MRLIFGDDFIKSGKKLPVEIQKSMIKKLDILELNPFDQRLHTKPLEGEMAGKYSLRITRDWRVLFRFNDGTTIYLINVGHRKDIYR